MRRVGLWTSVAVIFVAGVVSALVVGCGKPKGTGKTIELLNVSYDPTRELYQDFNKAFVQYWQEKTGDQVNVKMSHGGSGKQARSVIDGLQADVVTLALAYDVDIIQQKAGMIGEKWESRLPDHSAPYTSTIVFLVRKGNPKGVKDWDDLVKPDIKVITPNPQTSGGARWNYLAAWGFSLKRQLKDLGKLRDPNSAEEVKKAQEQAKQFVTELFQHVPVLDSGARGSTMTFVQREIGDVLLAWENEAFLAVQEIGAGKVEIVVPSISILAEPSVAMVEKNVDQHGTREVAEEYLKYLYTPAGQAIAAKRFYRPRNEKGVPAEDLKRFPKLELFTIDEIFGGWNQAQKEHFGEKGVFEHMYQAKK